MAAETVWMGEFNLFGYDLVAVSRSPGTIKRLFVEAWKEAVSQHGGTNSGIDPKKPTWQALADYYEVNLRQIPLDTVVWP